MKDKIIIFIVGLLLGAIISTGSIYFYTVAKNSNDNTTQQETQMPNGQGGQQGQPPEMPNGQGGQPGQPPEMPNSNTQNSN